MKTFVVFNYIALPYSEWTPEEQHAWSSAKTLGNVFDAHGAAASWSPHTQHKVELTVGRFLKWLLVQGHTDQFCVPAHIDEATLRAYLDFLSPRICAVSVHMYFADLLKYCRVTWPEADRSALVAAERNLRWRATPSRNKSAKIVGVGTLLDLGHELQKLGREQIDMRPIHGALLVRDGFAIRFLALRPLRIRAFGSLLLGQHLKQVGDTWHIAAPSELSKNKQTWEGPFPEALHGDLDYFLEVVRPILMSHRKSKDSKHKREVAHSALWVSRSGQAIPYKELGAAIAKRTKARFGFRIGPHLFRDCAATYVATHSGGDVGIVKSLLGHSTLRTAERHYNQASQYDAARKFDAAMGHSVACPNDQNRRNLR